MSTELESKILYLRQLGRTGKQIAHEVGMSISYVYRVIERAKQNA